MDVKPELIDIHTTGIGQGRDAKKVSDFTVNVGIKRPREKEESASGVAANAVKSARAPSPAR